VKIKRFFQISLIANFLLSLFFFFQQGIHSGVSLPHIDKAGHFIAFFVLAICVDLGTRANKYLAMFLLVGYGILVEFVQSHIPGREASIGDIVADSAGVLFYYFIFLHLKMIKNYKASIDE